MKDLDDVLVERWIAGAIPLVGNRLSSNSSQEKILDQLLSAKIIFLGETNHFVHEKTAFRLSLLAEIASRSKFAVGEELSAADGRYVARFLNGDDAILAEAATFGGKGHVRADRDDAVRGILKLDEYPYELMLAEHARLYQALRDLPHLTRYAGIDIDAPGAGYNDLLQVCEPHVADALARVEGESIADEISRLSGLATSIEPDLRFQLDALIDSLEYAAAIQDLDNYEALRPAMALREKRMKRNTEHLIESSDDATVVLMAHAFHLAKHDDNIEKQGVGPGGDISHSLGHDLSAKHKDICSVWMLYGRGEDSQPLADLPNKAAFPDDTINSLLARHISSPVLLPMTEDVRDALSSVRVGHLYNTIVGVNLGREADAIVFFPIVSPLSAS